SGPKTSIICSPMTSLKTSIKTITYLSDIGCLEIQGASLLAIKSVSRLYPCADLHICEFWHCEYLNIEYGCVHKAMYMKIIMYTSMYTHIVRFVASL
ncbi:hypothetical protein, partial [Escherichia coli]|uniref:hypothetical protein n=1 Tax=Escherichia coli TaxID=562 RepID=UPI001C705B23